MTILTLWFMSALNMSGESPLDTLRQRLDLARKQGIFVQPEPGRLAEAQRLFVATLEGKITSGLIDRWRAIGMQLERQGEILILQETENRGAGFYLFYLGEDTLDAALQIPHAFFDLHTREIGLKLFLEGRFRVASWNTIHRHHPVQGTEILADLADLQESFLQSLTAAWAVYAKDRPVLQIHGFTNKKRKDPAAARAAIILSNGTKKPHAGLALFASCLTSAGLGPVALYGRDTQDLGGVTNTQNQQLGSSGHRGFVHVELNAKLRDRLRRQKAMRSRFIQCIRPFEIPRSVCEVGDHP